MPPVPSPPAHADFLTPNATPSLYVSAMRHQWNNPNDILSILMLVGGDIVQRAVAQLAGTGPGPFAPVAFSFGWLAYSISALTSVIGDGRLLPPPDCPSVLINVQSEYARTNQSWILGRLLRDQEHRLEHECEHARRHAQTSGHDRMPARGLTIAFYHTSKTGEMGIPAKDWIYWAGVAVIVFQNLIATIPVFNNGNWVVLLVTFAGTLLALAGSALPQWRRDKYAARRVAQGNRKVCCLTRGNGAPVAIVFVVERGLRLEDLAGGKSEHSHLTLVATVTLCLLWILLLLTVEGLSGDAWYLLGIGGLGMAQNVLAAGARRSPHALGFHLEEGRVVNRPKVMHSLMEAEETLEGVGLALLPQFFPGPLRPEEQAWWQARRNRRAEAELATRRKMSTDKVKDDIEKARVECGDGTAILHVASQTSPEAEDLSGSRPRSPASSMTAFDRSRSATLSSESSQDDQHSEKHGYGAPMVEPN